MNFTWSFSSLKDYSNCPRQYQEVKVLKNFTKSVTPQMLYGTEVHKACEDYVAEGKPLAKNYERFKPVLDVFVNMEGTKYPEYMMGLEPGWVTDCGLSRSQQLKMLGNGVVPQQAEAAIHILCTGGDNEL